MKKVFLVLSLLMSLSIHSESKSVSSRSSFIMRMVNSAVLFIGATAVFYQNTQADMLQNSFYCSNEPCVHEGVMECKYGNVTISYDFEDENLPYEGPLNEIHSKCKWECYDEMALNSRDKGVFCNGKCRINNQNVSCLSFSIISPA